MAFGLSEAQCGFVDETNLPCHIEPGWMVVYSSEEGEQKFAACSHHLGHLLDRVGLTEYTVNPLFIMTEEEPEAEVSYARETESGLFSCPEREEDDEVDAWELFADAKVCTYCHGIHPEAAGALVEEGWKVVNVPGWDVESEDAVRTRLVTQESSMWKASSYILNSNHFGEEGFCELLHEALGGEWESSSGGYSRVEGAP